MQKARYPSASIDEKHHYCNKWASLSLDFAGSLTSDRVGYLRPCLRTQERGRAKPKPCWENSVFAASICVYQRRITSVNRARSRDNFYCANQSLHSFCLLHKTKLRMELAIIPTINVPTPCMVPEQLRLSAQNLYRNSYSTNMDHRSSI